MKVESINLSDFDTISSLYAFIDENAYELEKNWELTDVLVKYRNYTSDADEKQKMQWEVECFFFEIRGGKIFSLSSSNGKEICEIQQYPELDKFQEKAFDYVKHRAESAKCALLTARYNHLLWMSVKGIKNVKYASSAVYAYLESVKHYYQRQVKEDDQEVRLCILRLLENLMQLCAESNTGLNELKELIKILLADGSALNFWQKHRIVDNMLGFPKIFKASEFNNVLKIYETEIKRPDRSRSDDFVLAINSLSTAVKVARKLKSDVKKWYNEIGQANLRLANAEHEESRLWLKQKYYVDAILAFAEAGNTEMKAEIEQRYFELKPLVKLESFEVKFDKETLTLLRESHDKIKKWASELLKNDPGYIYGYICSGNYLPKYADLKEAAKDNKNAFLNFVTTVEFDKNKNIKGGGNSDIHQKQFLLLYSGQIRNNILPFLHYIFIPGIQSGHLTYKNLITFLARKSWIGVAYKYIDLGGKEHSINWIQLLIPSLVEYFTQIRSATSSDYYTPSLVLCMDSLTLKMEGLFRNLSDRLNISTSIGRTKGMQEAYIHNILENEIFKEYFNEDDIIFFKYLFVNNDGLNLRNNVAHSFYTFEEYSNDKMLLLLAALLRLAKYNVNQRHDYHKSGHTTPIGS